jgi:hypothetical protein
MLHRIHSPASWLVHRYLLAANGPRMFAFGSSVVPIYESTTALKMFTFCPLVLSLPLYFLQAFLYFFSLSFFASSSHCLFFLFTEIITRTSTFLTPVAL